MDIHRCRFVPFPASPINTIAFSHPLLSSKRPARLAIGRANGDIEIWNPLHGSWFQESIIHGGRDRSIDSLVWVTGDDEVLPNGSVIVGRSRLFSIGYTTTVTEWDLEQGRAKKHASGQHGDIWCMAAQPAPPPGSSAAAPGQSQRLVAGTIDGSLVLYSIDDDDLQFQRVLVKTAKRNIKMVSIAFQSRQIAVVGCSDSSIRVYDLRRGELLRKMTLGKDLIGGSKDIIVWSVKCLKNGDIVSGDSTGQIVIWDGKTYTQAQRIQGHKSDVLSLATSADGSSIISGGMDRRTALYRTTPRDPSRWQRVWHRKYHDHDVKAMASFEGHGMSVVVTGGPDATPVVTPLRQAGVENHRTLSHLPHSIPLQSAPQSRLIVSWWDREVHIWKLRRPMKDLLEGEDVEQSIEDNRKLLGRILIKGESNITSASISRDGTLLFVATATAIKAFHLAVGVDAEDDLKIRKIAVPASMENSGSTLVQISPNGQWLCWVQQGTKVLATRILRDDSSSESPVTIHPRPAKLARLRRDIPKHVRLGGLGGYDRRVTHVAFSPDSATLAAADLAGYIDTWVLQQVDNNALQNGPTANDDDASSESDSDDDDAASTTSSTASSSPRWTRNPKAALLPKLSHSPVVLSFSDAALGPALRQDEDSSNKDINDKYILLAITASSRIYTFHALEGALTRWSRRNAAWKLPDEIRATRDLIKGALWQGSRVWMYGTSFLFMLDIALDYEEDESSSGGKQNGSSTNGAHSKTSRKRKRGADTGAGSRMESAHSLAPQHVRIAGGGSGEWVDVEMADAVDADSHNDDDEDEDSEDENGELQKLRDQQLTATTTPSTKNKESSSEGAVAKRRNWWHTYKYRPILGVVPLSSAAPEEENEEQASAAANGAGAKKKNTKATKQQQQAATAATTLEVALVERPKWDVDTPTRYVED